MAITSSFALCKKNLLPYLQMLQFEYSLKDKLERKYTFLFCRNKSEEWMQTLKRRHLTLVFKVHQRHYFPFDC